MSRDPPAMTAEEFRTAVARLGFAASRSANDQGLSLAARFFGVDPRSARTWTALGLPLAVVIALRLMLAHNLDAAAAIALLADRRRARL
jgi:hypothetical protein